MKPLLLLLFSSLSLWGQTLPRPELTPGATRPLTLEYACKTHWGLDHRFVTAQMKADVCKAYGAADCPGPNWEIDHLVPRETLGADDVKNLWPQPIAEARLKDRVENWAAKQTCAGKLNLAYVQKTFEEDWRKLLVLYQATRPKPPTLKPPRVQPGSQEHGG